MWSNQELGTGFNTPVLKDGLLFGLSDRGALFCLNARTGETAWTDGVNRRENFGAIVDVGPVILALPSDSELIVLEPSVKAYAELARLKVADTPTYAHPVIAGKNIIVKDQDAVTMWTIQ